MEWVRLDHYCIQQIKVFRRLPFEKAKIRFAVHLEYGAKPTRFQKGGSISKFQGKSGNERMNRSIEAMFSFARCNPLDMLPPHPVFSRPCACFKRPCNLQRVWRLTDRRRSSTCAAC